MNVRTTMIGVAAAAVLTVAGATAVLAAAPSRTPADARVGGLAVGDLTRAELERRIRQGASRGGQAITVQAGTEQVVLARGETGVAVDVPATVEAAFGGRWSWWRSLLPGETQPPSVEAAITVDEDALRAATARVVLAADKPSAAADIRWTGREFAAVPPVSGQRATSERVRDALLAAGGRLRGPTLVRVATMESVPDISESEAQTVATALTFALPGVLAVSAGPVTVPVDGDRLAPAIGLARTSDPSGRGTRAAPILQARPATTLAAELSRTLTRPAVEPAVIVSAPATQLTAQGDATWRPVPARISSRRPGRAGQSVTPAAVLDALTTGVQAAVAGSSPWTNAAVERRVVLPRVADAQAGRVNAVLGTFTTAFACCQPRVTNISRIARTVSGTLVAPGQTFSLNGHVGPRTRAKGYVDAPYIRDGELASDIGGGVSQFATTLLNAAFFAGLHLERRQPHSFYISRYPAGREATVDYPGIDLQFINDTSAPVLIHATTTGTTLTVSVFGEADGRAVSARTGPRKPVPGKDFAITVTRVLALPARPHRIERYTAVYNLPPPE